ncbi:MAG: GLPGLI family protein, partial [Sphingobacteriaceae bacterium]
MKKILIMMICLFVYSTIRAQNTHFTTVGSVEFEKTINMFAAMKKQINKNNESYMQQVYDQYKKNQPQFKKLKSTLYFINDKTMFKPDADETMQSGLGSSAQTTQNN